MRKFIFLEGANGAVLFVALDAIQTVKLESGTITIEYTSGRALHTTIEKVAADTLAEFLRQL